MRCAPLFVAVSLLAPVRDAVAQDSNNGGIRIKSSDSVALATGKRYDASSVARMFLGNTYRELWTTPIKVPILDLASFAGGLKPLKRGGGLQTLSLRLENPQGRQFVFRLADKERTATPPNLKGSLIDRIFRDQVSALHPAGGMISAPILTAARIPHPTPVFAYMPDDPKLGEFRSDFAGKLGMIEEYPNVPAEGPGFAGALEIIDSDSLLLLMNSDPMHRVDARAFLKARLIDILLSDNDRHAGQWKWARMNADKPARWVAIPRDRDHALIHFDGPLVKLARAVARPTLILFEGSDMNLEALTEHWGFDSRMLAELDRAAWDSVAAFVMTAVTDSVIGVAVRKQPAEYQWNAANIAQALRERRDGLPRAIAQWYAGLNNKPEIHGSDAAERATITRLDDGFVDVRLESIDGVRYFERRFSPDETQEIRLFLHGGDDNTVVLGDVEKSILVRVVGGNGNNTFADSSRVGGRRGRQSRLYDHGETDGITYGEDTLFTRKPMVKRDGKWEPPGPDGGKRYVPRVGIGSHSLFGATPLIGFTHYDYAFRTQPYSHKLDVEAEYASSYGGWRLRAAADRRAPHSRFHLTGVALMSDLEVVSYRGLGNMLTQQEARSQYYEARQRQYLLQPSVAFALNSRSDLSVGGVMQYSVTDSVPNRFISLERPYGFGEFGQMGVRAHLHLDFPLGLQPAIVRDGFRPIFQPPLHRFNIDIEGIHYPEMWSVESPYQSVSAKAGTFLTVPFPLRTHLVMRGGAKMLFGEFPFHDAAYIGGRNSVRSIGPQSFEGDASLYGSAELRMRLAKFMFVLPLDAGALGAADAARVFVDGDSPGGWHAFIGGGLWIGMRDSPTVITFTAMTDGSTTRLGSRSGLSIRF